MHIVCYLRQGSRVFETYWTTRRGVEAMDNSYRLLDLTVYGRQEAWEDSPPGWPQRPKGEHPYRTDGRPLVQWSRLKAGHSETWEPAGAEGPVSDIFMTSRPASLKQASGNSRGSAARVVADWLCLAATPTFAIMALLTALSGGEPEILCAAMQHASPLSGMILMYLLMSAFHAAPWLKLICGR